MKGGGAPARAHICSNLRHGAEGEGKTRGIVRHGARCRNIAQRAHDGVIAAHNGLVVAGETIGALRRA
jgi:hypothetical protein